MNPYPMVARWTPEITDASSRVAAVQGVRVPLPVTESVMQIESGGDVNVATPGAYGLMQVTAGSMEPYDLPRAQADPKYGIWAGVNELAKREKDSGGLPWENVAVGYFSGHYRPTGQAVDMYGTTDTMYQTRFRAYMQEFGGDPQASGSSGVATRTGGATDAIVTAVGPLSRRVLLFAGGAGLMGVALWSKRSK